MARDMRKYRNLTAHTYRQALAVEVAAFVRARAEAGFEDALQTLRVRAEE